MTKQNNLFITATAALSLFAANDVRAQNAAPRGPAEVIHVTNPYALFGPQAEHPPGPFGAARTGGARPKIGGGNGINYNGGPVMVSGVNIYYIWYGNWSGNSATTILTDFANSIGGSPYFNINTTYYNGSGIKVPNVVNFAGYTVDNYSQGSGSLSDSAIATIVSSAISSGRLPLDSKGIYFVLTSADVTKSGFCSSYCGWHTHGILSGVDIKYSFVGNPNQCLSACAAQGIGPNGNAGADAMVSIIAHELEEATTDPDLNAWSDSRGYENADKCAWTFGATYISANGAQANMNLGGRDYLIQRNWVNASGGYCALSY